MPVTVEIIILPAFNDYLFAGNECFGYLGSRPGIYAGKVGLDTSMTFEAS